MSRWSLIGLGCQCVAVGHTGKWCGTIKAVGNTDHTRQTWIHMQTPLSPLAGCGPVGEGTSGKVLNWTVRSLNHAYTTTTLQSFSPARQPPPPRFTKADSYYLNPFKFTHSGYCPPPPPKKKPSPPPRFIYPPYLPLWPDIFCFILRLLSITNHNTSTFLLKFPNNSKKP